MKTSLVKLIFAVFTVSVFLVSCSSTTMINSIPQGAKLYIDGEYKGITPHALTDQKPVWGETQIKLKKSGYRDFNITVQKGEKFSPGACAGGLFLIIPYAWVMGYKSNRTYELQKGNQKDAE